LWKKVFNADALQINSSGKGQNHGPLCCGRIFYIGDGYAFPEEKKCPTTKKSRILPEFLKRILYLSYFLQFFQEYITDFFESRSETSKKFQYVHLGTPVKVPVTSIPHDKRLWLLYLLRFRAIELVLFFACKFSCLMRLYSVEWIPSTHTVWGGGDRG
jgi:hypothetical protein